VNYFGYDFSSVGLEAAQLRCPEVVFEKHDIYDPLPRKHHITVCSQTLEHLQHPERAAYHLVRGTADGGIVVFTVPDGRLVRYDKRRYRRRNRIEIMFGRLKDWRRIATRYDRCAKTFLPAVALAATVMFWL
jgi:hypothetical protein